MRAVMNAITKFSSGLASNSPGCWSLARRGKGPPDKDKNEWSKRGLQGFCDISEKVSNRATIICQKGPFRPFYARGGNRLLSLWPRRALR